jgi:hypothetical protein
MGHRIQAAQFEALWTLTELIEQADISMSLQNCTRDIPGSSAVSLLAILKSSFVFPKCLQACPLDIMLKDSTDLFQFLLTPHSYLSSNFCRHYITSVVETLKY